MFLSSKLREYKNSIPTYQHAQAVIDIDKTKIATPKLVDLSCSKIHPKTTITVVELIEKDTT
jgi:hypothetical protein